MPVFPQAPPCANPWRLKLGPPPEEDGEVNSPLQGQDALLRFAILFRANLRKYVYFAHAQRNPS